MRWQLQKEAGAVGGGTGWTNGAGEKGTKETGCSDKRVCGAWGQKPAEHRHHFRAERSILCRKTEGRNFGMRTPIFKSKNKNKSGNILKNIYSR